MLIYRGDCAIIKQVRESKVKGSHKYQYLKPADPKNPVTNAVQSLPGVFLWTALKNDCLKHFYGENMRDADIAKRPDTPVSGLASCTVMILVSAALYFIISRLSLSLAVGNSNASPVWPPSGIALAAILLWGYRMGPAVFIGAFFANILSLKGIGVAPFYYILASLSTAAGNMLEGMAGAWLIRRFAGSARPFENMKSLFIFITLGCLVSTMLSATTGVLGFCFITGDWMMFFSTWITWWLGDAAGIIVVAPVLLMMKERMPGRTNTAARIEIVLIFILLTVATAIIFWKGYRLEYLIIPPLVWIALRFGRFEVAAAVFLVSAIAIAGAIDATGLSTGVALNRSLLYLQSYIGVIAVITLCLSVLTHERRHSEKERWAIQKQMYDIIDFLPDATFAIDKGGKVIAWNKAVEALTGIPKEQMIGKGEYAYALPLYGRARPILIDIVMKQENNTSAAEYDYFSQKKNMVFAERYNPLLKRYLAGAASVLIDSEGAVYGAIESIRDISEQKTAELDLKHYKEHLEDMVKERSASLVRANEQLTCEIQERDRIARALTESERKYRDLVESANSVIIRWTPDGTITFLNTFGQNFFGYSESEIIGKKMLGTILPYNESTTQGDMSGLIDGIVSTAQTRVFNENENMKKNGEAVWIAWTNKPVTDEGGKVTEILSVGIDISARKKIEESLRRTLSELAVAKEQAEAADHIKSAFLATMSHELRTPLNSIIGFTGIILKGLAGPLNDEQTKQLTMVQGSSQHLLSLINDVLDISKIEAGQFDVYEDQFEVQSVIDKVIATMKPMADRKGLPLHVQKDPAVDTALADRRRVEQILINLISNAVKFSEHGEISIEISLIREYRPHDADPAIQAAGTVIQFAVTDNGIGIRPEDMQNIFLPFRQIDTGLARKNEGTGLGLAICRRLARLMKGEITARSEWGHGSTFAFILPLRGQI